MSNTIILASASPRRKDILTGMKLPFTVIPSTYDELVPADIPATKIPEYFARNKVRSVAETLSADYQSNWILGADTAIVYQDTLMGKPADRDEAYSFLTAFQGNTHFVLSGIALLRRDTGNMISLTSASSVSVKSMTEDEIQWYLNTDEWIGVAGAYRIQESFSRFISSISGSYSGIIGLPISELYDILKKLDYPFPE